MANNSSRKKNDIENPLISYGISMSVVGIAGILIFPPSAIPSIKTTINLVKNKSYIGNEPYLAATVTTIVICAVILIWGLKALLTGIKNIREQNLPKAPEFENCGELSIILEEKQLPSREKFPEKIAKKDKYFIIASIALLGAILIGIMVKGILPDEFFWDRHLSPGYFSFPLLLTLIITVAAAMRCISFFVYRRQAKEGTGVFEMRRSIRTETDIETISTEIASSLTEMQQNGIPILVSKSGYDNSQTVPKYTSQTHHKFFIETQPKIISISPYPIVFLYLVCAIILCITGFIFLTKRPPDNISVLTVPAIALGHAWTLIKGGILTASGIEFFSTVSLAFQNYLFQSMMVYLKANGVYKQISVKIKSPAEASSVTGNSGILRDWEFIVYITELLTEFDPKKGKRHIIKMFNDTKTKEAKTLISGTINSFNWNEKLNGNHLPAIRKEQ